MKVSKNRGTPSYHPNFSGIFPCKPTILDTPKTVETSIWHWRTPILGSFCIPIEYGSKKRPRGTREKETSIFRKIMEKSRFFDPYPSGIFLGNVCLQKILCLWKNKKHDISWLVQKSVWFQILGKRWVRQLGWGQKPNIWKNNGHVPNPPGG